MVRASPKKRFVTVPPPMTATGQFVLSPLSSAAAGYEEILGEAGEAMSILAHPEFSDGATVTSGPTTSQP